MSEHKLAKRHTAPGFTEPADVHFDYTEIRRAFERYIGPGWRVANQGPRGIAMAHRTSGYTVIVSQDRIAGAQWIHASIANREYMPNYEDLVNLHKSVFGQRYAYQLFVPSRTHVSIHPFALHLWGRADGTPCMPDFGAVLGSI